MALNIALKVAILNSKRRQVDIAKQVGMHESRLSRIIRGHDVPTRDEKRGLAIALYTTVEALFPEEAVA